MEVNDASGGERGFLLILVTFPNGAPRHDWMPALAMNAAYASCSKARRPP